MQSLSASRSLPAKRIWAGRVLGGLAVLFLLFDAAIKLINIQPVVDSFKELGYPPNIGPAIGSVLLACVIVHLIPRLSIAGAVLLTGYLGGAVATHVRVGNPLFSHTLFPLYVGAMIWGGLYLRDRRTSMLIESDK